MYLNRLNFKVQCLCKNTILRRFASILAYQNHKDLLMDYFGLPCSEVQKFEKKHKIYRFDIDHILDSITFCESIGYSKEDLIKHPSLLKTHPLTLDQYHRVLTECGFQNVSPKILTRFRNVSNSTVENLKKFKMIPQDKNVAENLLTYLDPQPDFNVDDLDDEKMLSIIHVTIIKKYLMWRLDASQEEIERVFRVYKMIPSKSLYYLCENIRIAEMLGFMPLRKLLKYGYLLHNYPNYPKTMLTSMPKLAGFDLCVAMRRYPKLTTVSPRNYITIYNMLKEANIPDETIQKTMNIFYVSPKTVRQRLNEINNIPEFRIHLCNPKVLKLIVHYNRAKSRLSFLQEVKLKCASLYVMGNDIEVINSHVREGKDVNIRNEVIAFVKHLLKTDNDVVITNLEKHPYYLHVPLLQIEETFNYVIEYGFQEDSLISCPQVLLYPKETVQTAIAKLEREMRNSAKNLDTTKQLYLIMYFMEKEHHFTGNGIWRNNVSS